MYFQLKFQGLMKLFSPKFTDLIFHFVCVSHFTKGGWGGRWCDGAGKLPVPGRPTIWITVGQGPTALTVGWARGCLDIFTLIYPFFPLSPSLWETIRYRLNYCLKGPLNPKNNQPTNYQGGGGGGGGGTCVVITYVSKQNNLGPDDKIRYNLGLKCPIFIVGGRVVRRWWVNFQCRGVLLIWNTVGQGPTVLAVSAGGGCVDIFSVVCNFSPFSLSLSLGDGHFYSHLSFLSSFSLSLGDGPI